MATNRTFQLMSWGSTRFCDMTVRALRLLKVSGDLTKCCSPWQTAASSCHLPSGEQPLASNELFKYPLLNIPSLLAPYLSAQADPWKQLPQGPVDVLAQKVLAADHWTYQSHGSVRTTPKICQNQWPSVYHKDSRYIKTHCYPSGNFIKLRKITMLLYSR